MEGVITCAVALFAVSFMVRFPDEEKQKPSWGFLNPDELDFVIDRLNADRGDVELEKFTWKKFLQPATVSNNRQSQAAEADTAAGVVHLRIRRHPSPYNRNILWFCLLSSHYSEDEP